MYKITYTGDGSTHEYPFTFPYFQDADIKISVNSQLLDSGHYTIVPTPDSTMDGRYAGGRIVLTDTPNIGAVISIWRKIELTRTVDYQPTLPISTASLNADFNFLMEYLRDIYDIDGHAANIENGMQFLDSVQAQITEIGDLSELARKSDLPDLTEYAKLNEVPNAANFAPVTHTHENYVTNSEFEQTISEISENILQFDEDDEPDVVVKTQLPTAANNYTWYRLYKSGWVEQGGIAPASQELELVTVTIPVAMQNSTYGVLVTNMTPETTHSGHYGMTVIYAKSQNQFRIASISSNLLGFAWFIQGPSIQTQS